MPENEPAEAQPWEKQTNETSKAFHAFTHYRDLTTTTRSIQSAYREHLAACEGHAEATATAPRHWKGWSQEKEWVRRAGAHDSDLAAQRRERRASDLAEAQDNIAVVSRNVLTRVSQRLLEIDPKDIPVHSLSNWLKTASETLLRSLGDEEKFVVSAPDGGPVQVDQTVHVPDPETWAKILAIRENIGDVEPDKD